MLALIACFDSSLDSGGIMSNLSQNHRTIIENGAEIVPNWCPKPILEGLGVLLGLLQMVLGLQGAPRDARGLILVSFWTSFGIILGQFLLPKYCFCMCLGMDFGAILG